MALIVQKFGGTSVANTTRIQEISKTVLFEYSKGNKIVIVVSAMAGVTNQLVTYCNEISTLNNNMSLAEYDAALCSGEMVTAALTALSLQQLGISSRSVFAWQLPIMTSNNYSKAIVESLNTKLLMECLDDGFAPVVAGFQGITADNRCTTLGRGGSDTTASLIAAAINADRCDIYTDVLGVFTADPRVVLAAQKIDSLNYEEMLEFASSGAKVLHPRCIEVAMRYNIPIRVLSSFYNDNGTLITAKNKIMENRIITGITSNKNLLKVNIQDQKISLNQICRMLSLQDIHIELMLNLQDSGRSFIVQLNDKSKLESILKEQKIDFITDSSVAIVSLVGYGIKNDNQLISKILEILDNAGILVTMMQNSEIKVSILINDSDTEKAVKALHELVENEHHLTNK